MDGNLFKQDIPYQLNCQGDLNQPWNVTLTFSGTLAGTGFDNATLRTSSPMNNGKLGIQIQKDGIPLELNKAFAIDSSNPPDYRRFRLSVLERNWLVIIFLRPGH